MSDPKGNEILAAVITERLRLADFLDTLEDHEWNVQSLCAGWTVTDVVAHLTLSTNESFLAFLRAMIRARGNMDRAFDNSAREQAAKYEPAELIALMRETATSKRHMIGSLPVDRLIDVLVHGQDIAVPLGRTLQLPKHLVIPMLDRAWKSSFYGGSKRFDGIKFIANDAVWSGGAGPQVVQGPIGDILLLVLGRKITLDRFAGPGLERLEQHHDSRK